jgi:predicted GIY-YIG superfamily endonuclease
MWFCYILRNTVLQYSRLTYNGSTNDPIRRLRQHNEEISGGARFTHGRGKSWEIYVLLTGFQDHINTLSCEWRIKHPSGKPGPRQREYSGVEGRVKSLNQILGLPRWTGKCTIENSTCKYVLYIVEDMVRYLDLGAIPENIQIITVAKIDKLFLSNIMKAGSLEKIDTEPEIITQDTDA